MEILGILLIILLIIAYFIAFIIKSIEFLFKNPKWFFIKAAIGGAIIGIIYLTTKDIEDTSVAIGIVLAIYTILLFKIY